MSQPIPTPAAVPAVPAAPAKPRPPQRPPDPPGGGRSQLLRPLGIFGWDRLEPVVLAALATGDPMLLVGRHGTAKSLLLERLARALGLEHRFYNASLIDYDDLVGVPVPNASRTALEFIATPAAIWGAEVVFLDEINRTRPDLQNKLFPIIHERRVQGVDLPALRYRWAAMNPAPGEGEDFEGGAYLGAETLDPALADRFAFLIEVPEWGDLDEADAVAVLLSEVGGGPAAGPPCIASLVDAARVRFEELRGVPQQRIVDYLLSLEPLLRRAGMRLSGRRMTLLLRCALGVHAARETLAGRNEAGAGCVPPAWEDSLHLAVQNALPALAAGPLDRGAVMVFHRQAWKLSGLSKTDGWRSLLRIPDSVERLRVCLDEGIEVDRAELSVLIADALGSRPARCQRAALALVLREALRFGPASAMCGLECLAESLEPVLRPATLKGAVFGSDTERCKEVEALREELGGSLRDRLVSRLLASFLPRGFDPLTPRELMDEFLGHWEDFGAGRSEAGSLELDEAGEAALARP